MFYTREVDQYKKANLHISIDYSGSMSGEKLRKAVTSTVAIVKACEMARNINVQVSIRSTDSSYGGLPYIALVHDSTKKSFKEFCKNMSILQANNTTPEGLCFEAIQKQLIPSNNDSDSYFLNFSDGEPCFSINRNDDEINYGRVEPLEYDVDNYDDHVDFIAFMREYTQQLSEATCPCMFEAEYQGRTVKLGKPMQGDVKKFKVYVKNGEGNVVKVNFGDPNMRIKKSNPERRKSFRARHNCDNPGPRWKARYWSCRKW